MVKNPGESQLPGRWIKENIGHDTNQLCSLSLSLLMIPLGRSSTLTMWERNNAGEEAEEKKMLYLLFGEGPLSSPVCVWSGPGRGIQAWASMRVVWATGSFLIWGSILPFGHTKGCSLSICLSLSIWKPIFAVNYASPNPKGPLHLRQQSPPVVWSLFLQFLGWSVSGCSH